MSLIVAILIAQLGSDHCATRERASDALLKIGPAAHAQLEIAEKSKCPETAARARRILDQQYIESLNSTRRWPWVDSQKYPKHLEAANAKGKSVYDDSLEDWPNWREATRTVILDMRQRQCPQQEIQVELDRLWKMEADWYGKFRKPDMPD